MSQALLLVDVQNDFSPSGALPVAEGDKIVPVINQLIPHFDHVIATKDWHPAGHSSFASSNNQAVGDVIVLDGTPQIMWPDHCVQGTEGAEFIDGLNVGAITQIIHKGTNPNIDSYSGFFDNQRLQATGLAEYLNAQDIKELVIVGLATDYCVKFTAIDAVSLGFKTSIVQDACRGVEMATGDVESAWKQMKQAGCKLVQSRDFVNQ
ncbi:bifunctional nicotinamidase/pyrazinamidase [Vibrio ziniensis]|uniref:Nicotinamidase n=1 Tax=Vibrio ziniensis TaxID=2711221 RepID=A0A6G7CQ21_9VIBR|nr:bifunctional nicotinamidase/pyrazinamidase [Vibrio ziniensis]QIH44179.1 bifunctional nicotinamidase/pyrazinamidase [Vibrio ziniensis]